MSQSGEPIERWSGVGVGNIMMHWTARVHGAQPMVCRWLLDGQPLDPMRLSAEIHKQTAGKDEGSV